MAKIDTIEGIGPALSEKFSQAGISACETLLEKGSTKNGRKELEAATGISEAQILKFVNHADLMRIKGVGGEYAELLEHAGVDTVPELAQRNAENLAAKMVEINLEKKLVRSTPTEKQAHDWIKQAKTLPKIIQY
ncbi:MAG: DUF4332 domain-containing protein [Gammaproteobacteria bacterium]|nr:DUF4332 domain-containing protein [Gammaproteobacteria bacterium]MDH3412749.1 DUF4332 domain-containing protein [Gammaproteobacteria bacterium]